MASEDKVERLREALRKVDETAYGAPAAAHANALSRALDIAIELLEEEGVVVE